MTVPFVSKRPYNAAVASRTARVDAAKCRSYTSVYMRMPAVESRAGSAFCKGGRRQLMQIPLTTASIRVQLRCAAIAMAVATTPLSAATVAAQSTAAGSADTYPSRPVRVIVGLAPGGGTDIFARLFAQKLGSNLGRSFVVENRPGAGGTVAYAAVAKFPADGYTLLAVASGYAITPAFYRNLAYDPIADFAPIALVTEAPILLMVHPSLPVKSTRELIALAKAKHGSLDAASAGMGTSNHLALELFNSLAGVKIAHIPYKGTGQALVDFMAGQVHLMFGNIVSSLPYVKAGRARTGGHRPQSVYRHANCAHGRGVRRARLRDHHLARVAGARRHPRCYCQ